MVNDGYDFDPHQDKAALEPGKLYRISLQDCCIGGEIYGTFQYWDEDECMAYFDFGRIGPEWGAWHPEEVEVVEAQDV